MRLQNSVPSIHSVDLVAVVFLAGAGCHVSKRPLAVSSRDLLHAELGVRPVVAKLVLLFRLGSAVLQIAVEEAASLLAAQKVALHSPLVRRELGNPAIFGS